jgi:transcriptional regulator with XRE-family HTH domain
VTTRPRTPNPDPDGAVRFRRDLGRRIYAARIAANLEQAELGQLAGCHGSAFSKYETGKNLPSLELLRRIAKALDTTIGHLTGDER